MMAKRKLGGVGNRSSIDQEICKSDATVHNQIKFGGLPAEPDFMADSQLGRQADTWAFKIQARFEVLKACCRSKHSIIRFV